MGARVHKGAECGVRTFQDFSVHGTGFSQWLVTNFMSAEFIRRKFWRAHLLMCRKFSAVQEHCPPEKPFANRYSPFATRYRFGSAGASSSHFFPSLVPRPVLRGVYKSAIWCYINCMEMPRWRNWQTRWLEGPVGFTDPCGFKSRPRHHFLFGRFCSQFFHSHP